MDTLKARLRLAGATNASAVIDQAVEDVRVGFYRRLTAETVTTLLAIAYSEAPTTDDEVKRSLANYAEVKWVRKELLRTLPTLFMDTAGKANSLWNEEAGFQRPFQSQINKEIDKLEAEIDDALRVLSGEDGLRDNDSMNVSTIEPEDEVDYPGATIWPALRAPS